MHGTVDLVDNMIGTIFIYALREGKDYKVEKKVIFPTPNSELLGIYI